MSYRLTPPRIRWGTSLATDLYLPYALDNVVAGQAARAGSEYVQGPSGTEDAWITGEDYTLAFDARWIPGVDQLSPLGTGWDGVYGWRAFLAWARRKNLLRFYPDGRNLLWSPAMNADANSDGIVDEWGVVPGLLTVTPSFDAGQQAQKLVVSNGTGSPAFCELVQAYHRVPAGAQFAYSIEYKTSGLPGGGAVGLSVDGYDDTPTSVANVTGASGGAQASFTRLATPLGSQPANATQLRISSTVTLPAGGSATVWFRKAVLQNDAVPNAYLDAPYLDCYLVDPSDAEPGSESDGTRKISVKLRQASAEFAGY